MSWETDITLTGKPLDSIDETALQGLIESQVKEGKTIEYKATLLGKTYVGLLITRRKMRHLIGRDSSVVTGNRPPG